MLSYIVSLEVLLVYLLIVSNMTLILSFLQQYFTKLSERTVAYINVDISVYGKKLHLYYLSGVNENI